MLARILCISAACALIVVNLAACSTAGIAIREQLGYAKREQLVARVEDARDSQTDAKKQFESALEEFLAVTGASADAKTAELEARYKKLKSEFDRSESRADAVKSRITDVERVAEALFKEWNAELAQYTNAELRASSERQLNDTRREYDQLVGVMKTAAGKMDPVLAAFKDQVLFLKHNLNARAIASLQGEAQKIQTDVTALIREMQKSVDEANEFIQQMKK
jgi:ElaB/YqjD/DUF883 family membrane-anchored ribosome-binding protein